MVLSPACYGAQSRLECSRTPPGFPTFQPVTNSARGRTTIHFGNSSTTQTSL